MNKTEKNAGWIAGISLIIMSLAAGFSYGYVQHKLLNTSVEITRQNVIENKYLFFAGLAGWMVILISDLIVAGALYVFFKSILSRLSLLTALIRIAYTLVLGVAVYQLFGILLLLHERGTAHEISSHLASFEKIWSVGLIVFGFHLLGLGYLSMTSRHIPWLLSYLLYLAGLSYVLIHSGKTFALFHPQVIDSAEKILALPMALSEIMLAVWLIYKAWKPDNLSKVSQSSTIKIV